MFTRNAFATLVALFACTPAPSHAVQEVTVLDPVYVTAPMPNEYGCQY